MIKSPFPDVVIPNIGYGQYVFQHLSLYGDAVAMIDGDTNQTLTFADIKNLIIKCANAFKNHGIEKGDCISTCIANCMEYPVIVIAAAMCGAIVSTCASFFTEDEIFVRLKNVQPKLVIVDQSIYEKAKRVVLKLDSVKDIISIDKHPECPSLHDWMSSAQANGFPYNVTITPSDTCMIFHSSGTTGVSKSVVLTNKNMVAYGEIMKIGFSLCKRTVACSLLQMFNAIGILLVVISLLQGSVLVFNKRFHVKTLFTMIERFKINLLMCVPAVLLSISNNFLLGSNFDLSSLKIVKCGGAPLPERLAKETQKNLNVRVCQGYGLTEANFASSMTDIDAPINSVGVPFPNHQVKIIDPESGKTLGRHRHGEICVKGPLVMQGYLHNPSATAQAIDSEGWLHTGDIGYIDQLGYLYVIDRLKELIKYKGFQVAPAELEQLLIQHPNITDAAVIGIPDSEAGELPKAFLVSNNEFLTEHDVHEFMKGKVSSFKHLKGGVEFCEEIPRSVSGKILRRYLKTRHLQKSKL